MINFVGTKYKESKELDNIDFSRYKYIIEPFAGSFGFSRYLYSDRAYKNIKYIFYDSDEELINFYNHIKHLINNNMLEDFINEYNNYVDYFKEHFKVKDKILNKVLIKKYIKTIENKFIVFMISRNILDSKYTICSYKYYKNLHIDDLDLIKNSDFIHQNFLTIDFTKYNKKESLFYLDPPYILSDNMNYKDKSLENIFEVILKLYKKNYKCMFIHSYNYLLDFVFKKYNYMSYEKKYGNTGNLSSHIVYYNP